jgi:hypothetical protein
MNASNSANRCRHSSTSRKTMTPGHANMHSGIGYSSSWPASSATPKPRPRSNRQSRPSIRQRRGNGKRTSGRPETTTSTPTAGTAPRHAIHPNHRPPPPKPRTESPWGQGDFITLNINDPRDELGHKDRLPRLPSVHLNLGTTSSNQSIDHSADQSIRIGEIPQVPRLRVQRCIIKEREAKLAEHDLSVIFASAGRVARIVAVKWLVASPKFPGSQMIVLRSEPLGASAHPWLPDP